MYDVKELECYGNDNGNSIALVIDWIIIILVG